MKFKSFKIVKIWWAIKIGFWARKFSFYIFSVHSTLMRKGKIRIRIRTCDSRIWMQIQEAQKHTDPEHWFCPCVCVGVTSTAGTTRRSTSGVSSSASRRSSSWTGSSQSSSSPSSPTATVPTPASSTSSCPTAHSSTGTVQQHGTNS